MVISLVWDFEKLVPKARYSCMSIILLSLLLIFYNFFLIIAGWLQDLFSIVL